MGLGSSWELSQSGIRWALPIVSADSAQAGVTTGAASDTYRCPAGQRLRSSPAASARGGYPCGSTESLGRSAGPVRPSGSVRRMGGMGAAWRSGHTRPAAAVPSLDGHPRRPAHSYQQRQHLVEPVFGIIKEQQRARRFLLRGLANVAAEWALLATAFNLRTLWRLWRAPPPEAAGRGAALRRTRSPRRRPHVQAARRRGPAPTKTLNETGSAAAPRRASLEVHLLQGVGMGCSDRCEARGWAVTNACSQRRIAVTVETAGIKKRPSWSIGDARSQGPNDAALVSRERYD